MSLPKKMPQNTTGAGGDTIRSTNEKRVILNRYQVEKKLGSGNFGTAYLVVDLKTTSKDDSL